VFASVQAVIEKTRLVLDQWFPELGALTVRQGSAVLASI